MNTVEGLHIFLNSFKQKLVFGIKKKEFGGRTKERKKEKSRVKVREEREMEVRKGKRIERFQDL